MQTFKKRLEEIGRIQVEGKGIIKNFKMSVSSDIETPGLLSFKREEWWEQVKKYTEVNLVWKVVNSSYMPMVDRTERKWHELHHE